MLTNGPKVEYDNAFYIHETAGLLVLADKASYGTEAPNFSKEEALQTRFNKEPEDVTTVDNISLKKGAILYIPAAQGDFIKIYMKQHAVGSGSELYVYNATDLAGKPYSTVNTDGTVTCYPLHITRYNTPYSDPEGCYILKAATDETNPYVALMVADDGWTDFARIEVAQESMESSMCLTKGARENNPLVKFDDSNNSYVRPVGNSNFEFVVSAGSDFSAVPVATNIVTTLEPEGHIQATISNTNEEKDSKGNLARRYNYTIKVTGGAGRLRIHQAVYDDNTDEQTRHLINQHDTWIAVGQITQQTYPYTWDFTAKNVKENTYKSSNYKNRKNNTTGFGSWTTGGNHVNVNETYTDEVLNVTYTKPAFAAGSELLSLVNNSSSTGGTDLNAIEETAGVGFGSDKGNVGLDNTSIGFAGDKISITPTSITNADGTTTTSKPTVTIPGLKTGDRIYVKLAAGYAGVHGYSSTNATNVLGDANDCQDDVFRFDANADGDVTLTFDAAVTIEKIAVTNILKKINSLGYATESRDRAIDYDVNKEMTKNYVGAYYIKQVSTYDRDKLTTTKEAVTNNCVKDNTGLILYRTPDDKSNIAEYSNGYTSPLFVPAINIAKSAAAPEGNMMVANVSQQKLEKEEGKTFFILTNKFYHYDKATGTASYQTGKNAAFYMMHLFGDNRDIMGANKAYLSVPKTYTDIWAGETPQQNAKMGYIFFDDDEQIITGIDTPNEDNRTVMNDNATYYTLQGVKLESKPTKSGIYILNGKKIYIK